MTTKTTAELIAWNKQMALSLSLTEVANAKEFIENHKATADRLAEQQKVIDRLKLLLGKAYDYALVYEYDEDEKAEYLALREAVEKEFYGDTITDAVKALQPTVGKDS